MKREGIIKLFSSVTLCLSGEELAETSASSELKGLYMSLKWRRGMIIQRLIPAEHTAADLLQGSYHTCIFCSKCSTQMKVNLLTVVTEAGIATQNDSAGSPWKKQAKSNETQSKGECPTKQRKISGRQPTYTKQEHQEKQEETSRSQCRKPDN